MKRLIVISILLLSASLYSFGQSKNQKIQTDKIHVSGICDECKERIEDAAYLSGTKRADWDKNTQTLTVSYKQAKVSLLEIKKNIAKAGHDAGDIHATDSAYQQLPHCCAYKDGAIH